ncbi:MAG: GxxExxY protein [Fluviicola sp.]|nr:GxxExxY protein [Fluviicola sp.]
MIRNSLSKIIIGCAIEVHKQLGPGLLESAYQECLIYELKKQNLRIEVEKPMPIIYKDISLNKGYRIDILVEDEIVIELKTVEQFRKVHSAQVLTYMRLGGYELGLLLNFNETKMVDGIKRLIST